MQKYCDVVITLTRRMRFHRWILRIPASPSRDEHCRLILGLLLLLLFMIMREYRSFKAMKKICEEIFTVRHSPY